MPQKCDLQTLWVDPHSGLKTVRNTLRVDRGVCFEVAQQRLLLEGSPEDGSSFFVSKKPVFGKTLVLLAIARAGFGHMFSVYRPNTGAISDLADSSSSSECSHVATQAPVCSYDIFCTSWRTQLAKQSSDNAGGDVALLNACCVTSHPATCYTFCGTYL
jgi:hypothetical protein